MQPVYPRDTAQMLLPAVTSTLDALNLGEQDKAAAKLAIQYARHIDDAATSAEQEAAIRRLGPLLLDALEALGATPRSRKTKPAQPGTTPAADWLTEMRASHAGRA